jgi:hypothetical protein
MSPQLTVQQLEHAIAVYERRVEAKKLEIESYSLLSVHVAAINILLDTDVAADESLSMIKHAAVNLFTAKHTVATIELEELELTVRALRQQRSGIVGAGMVIPPFKPNQRH